MCCVSDRSENGKQSRDLKMILKPLFIAVVIGCRGSVLDSLMSAQHDFFMHISKDVDDDGNE